MDIFLKETDLLDYSDSRIQQLIIDRDWQSFPEQEKIVAIYNFVRDEIKFGYNVDDAIPASSVLHQGYGQCNTKAILFMALLRAVNVSCRLHGFTINKELQKGLASGIGYQSMPNELPHCWVEVFFNKKWINLEGFVIDLRYLRALQKKFNDCSGRFFEFGVAVSDFKNPQVYWNGGDTYIQKESIISDLGTYDDPDVFFRKYRLKSGFFSKLMYKHFTRHKMNRVVREIRQSLDVQHA